jgi:hypothetical protein
MKLSKPRIEPLTEAEWTDEQRKTLEPRYREGVVYNVTGYAFTAPFAGRPRGHT